MRALFLCSRNRLRSPTAEQVFFVLARCRDRFGRLGARCGDTLEIEQIRWADVLFVMERKHKTKLTKKFGRYLNGKRIVCLDIPDKYDFMDPELIALLLKKAGALMR
jgi:predicted protein tyrosine phosphatase